MSEEQNYTSSNWPNVKPDCIAELHAVIEKYDFPGGMRHLKVVVHDGTGRHGSEDEPYLKIMGYASFDPTKPIKDEDGSVVNQKHGFAEEFLEAIAPYLDEQLVIRTIGHNKLRFPFLATQWSVWPDGTTRYDNFDNSPEKPDSAE